MAEPAKFWDKIARKYAAQPVRSEAAYQQKLAVTQTFFTPETRLFEFACGTGTTALYHAPKVASVLATDISDEMLAIAREKLAASDLKNVRFEKWNSKTDPITEDGFDVVMGHSILHLVKDRTVVLSKVHQLLKPGGIFVSSTVCLGARAYKYWPLISIARLFGKAPYVSMLTREKLESEIKNAGFELIALPEGDYGEAVFLTARKV